jgi:hypothetical protein
MDIRPIHTVALVIAVAVGAGGWWLAAAEDLTDPLPPYHADGKKAGQAAIQAAGALLRDDRAVAREALGQLRTAYGQLAPEEIERFGSRWRILDQALHRVLANTREYVGAKEMEQAFDEFVWVQRTCRHCHDLARQSGLLPADGPFWTAATVPAERVETTQSVREKP